jgi:CheY-like chemotaxis protein
MPYNCVSKVIVNKAVVLYAEDEPTDVMLLRRAIRKAQLPVELLTVSDGQYLINWLSGAPPFDDRRAYPIPELIITDLKMPLTHGFEVLRWIYHSREFYRIPLVVYSTSDFPSDMENSVRLGALAYFRKTHCCANLIDFLRGWLANRPQPQTPTKRRGTSKRQETVVA